MRRILYLVIFLTIFYIWLSQHLIDLCLPALVREFRFYVLFLCKIYQLQNFTIQIQRSNLILYCICLKVQNSLLFDFSMIVLTRFHLQKVLVEPVESNISPQVPPSTTGISQWVVQVFLIKSFCILPFLVEIRGEI